VAAMSVAIEHCGPDDWGKLVFKDAAIVMNRLNIIDLGGGHRPYWEPPPQKSRGSSALGEIWHRIFIEQEKSAWPSETQKIQSRSFASLAG
jgi:asparagine synthetase B (glutamine-hydrolysing)